MTKKMILLIISTICLVSCTHENDFSLTNATQTEPVKMIEASLDFTVEQDSNVTEKSRALPFEKGANAEPKLNLLGKKTMPVTCVFYNAASKLVTKVKLDFDVTGKKTLKIGHLKTFNLRTNSASQNDQWYVMGFIGGNFDGENLVFNEPYCQTKPNHTGIFELDIPYVFLWKKLTLSTSSKGFLFLRAKKASVLKPLGTVVQLSVTNKTSFPIKYNGFTLISSGDTKGRFNLNNATKLATTFEAQKIGENNSPTAEGYLKLIEAMWEGANERLNRPQLAYTNYKRIENEDISLNPNEKDNNIYYVWFMPKEAVRGGYDKQNFPNLKAYKTQFLLHSKAVKNSDPEVAMLPVYGSKYAYETGHSYAANGTMLYEYGPLNYLAEGNLNVNGTFSESSKPGNQYLFNEMWYVKVPQGYHLPTRLEWQSIFPRYAGLGFDEEWCALTVADLGNKRAIFTQYGSKFCGLDFIGYKAGLPNFKNNFAKLNNEYHHIVTLSSMPKRLGAFKNLDPRGRYHVEPEMGLPYLYDKQSTGQNYSSIAYGKSLKLETLSFQQDNKYQTAIRINNVNINNGSQDARLVLIQRYLGPNYVIAPYDIQDNRYWNYTGRDDLMPQQGELQRTLPLPGITVATDESFKYVKRYSTGVSAIYWSNTQVDTENTLDPTDSKKHRLPLYLNVLYKEYSRTDNAGDNNQDTFYKRYKNSPSVPLFKGYVRLFKNTPSNR